MTDLSQKLDIIISLIKQGQGGEQARQDLEKLDKQQKETARSADTLQRSFSDLSRQLLSLVGFQQVTSLLRDSIRAFAEQEAAVAKLEGTMRAGGKYTEDYSQEVQDLAGALQTLTGQQDDAILGVSTFLISSGAARSEVARLTEQVLDLSAGLGTDLNSAAMMVGKALQGETGTFGRFGFQIDETKTKGEQLAAVLEQIESRFGGLGRAAAQTASGELTAISNLIGDIKEQLGQNFLEFYAEQILAAKEFLGGGAETETNPFVRADVNERQIQTLLKQLDAARASGSMDFKTADALAVDLQSAIGQRQYAPVSPFKSEQAVLPETVNFAAEQAAISAAMQALRPTPARPAPTVATEPTAAEALNNRDALAALEELRKLQNDLSTETVSGFERERAAAEKTFAKRMADIEALAKRGAETDAVSAARADADLARKVALGEISTKEAAEFAKAEEKKLADVQRTAAEIQQLRDNLTIGSVSGYQRERVAAKARYDDELAHIEELRNARALDAEQAAQFRQLALDGYEQEVEAIRSTEEAHRQAQFWASQTGQVIQGSAQIISGNFASALTGAFEGGDKAFQVFVKNTLAGIGQMITQMLIFRAIMGVAGAAIGGAASTTPAGMQIDTATFNLAPLAADGGFFPRMMASGGMQMLDRATYLPNFNVVAGEQGREMLAVLAQPRMMQIGGVQAAVGNMEGKSMAVVPTSAIGGGATGGSVTIRVEMAPGLVGQIVEQSTQASVQVVTSDLQRRTPLAAAVKQAAGTN